MSKRRTPPRGPRRTAIQIAASARWAAFSIKRMPHAPLRRDRSLDPDPPQWWHAESETKSFFFGNSDRDPVHHAEQVAKELTRLMNGGWDFVRWDHRGLKSTKFTMIKRIYAPRPRVRFKAVVVYRGTADFLNRTLSNVTEHLLRKGTLRVVAVLYKRRGWFVALAKTVFAPDGPVEGIEDDRSSPCQSEPAIEKREELPQRDDEHETPTAEKLETDATVRRSED